MNTLEQVIQIVADCLNLSPSIIDKESSANNIDIWDSMAQVNLMIALEQSFDIELEVEDFMKLNSVQAITNYLDAKL